MTRIAPAVLRRYLLGGQLPTGGCLRRVGPGRRSPRCWCPHRYHSTQASSTLEDIIPETTIPFRKQLKDEAKKRKVGGSRQKSKKDNQKLENWELTVGIEIHAQLNTERKLFSAAASTINDVPN